MVELLINSLMVKEILPEFTLIVNVFFTFIMSHSTYVLPDCHGKIHISDKKMFPALSNLPQMIHFRGYKQRCQSKA